MDEIESISCQETKHLFWENRIPVIIKLSLEEFNSSDSPPNLIVRNIFIQINIERIGYISSCIKDLILTYKNYLPLNFKDGDIWFSYNNIPIKWNLPFGVIIDSIVKDTEDVPIYLIAHVKNFPEQDLVRYKSVDSLRFYYLNFLKESFTIRYGSAKGILNLSTRETEKLVDIAFSPKKNFKEFWEIIATASKDLKLNRFAVKFLFDKTNIIINKPFTPYCFDEKINQTEDIIPSEIVEIEDIDNLELKDESKNEVSLQTENSNKMNLDFKDINKNFDLKHFIINSFDKGTSDYLLNRCKIRVLGDEIPLNIPMIYLAENYVSLDLILYISVYEL